MHLLKIIKNKVKKMTKKQGKGISRIILLGFISITVISIVLTGFFWIYNIFGIFQNNIRAEKSDFVYHQKILIQNEVESVINYIEYNRSKAENILKNKLKNRLYEAYSIALHIYNENSGKRPNSEIQKMVKDALRAIRFNDGRGYYFAVNLNGIVELDPDSPNLEGKNMIDLQDQKGNLVIKNKIDLVKKQEEGFIIDFWEKAGLNDGNVYAKITFVKKFAPFNWYIGTGEYLDDVEKEIKKDIQDRVSDIRFGEEGYIFVNKFDGTQLITNGKLVNEYKNLKDLEDIDGTELLKKEVAAAQMKDGDFIEYSFSKMTEDEPISKISYIKGIPDWEWIVGAGFYKDDIDKLISNIEYEERTEIRKNVIKIALILFSLLILSIIISRWFFLRLKRNFEVFENFFIAATEKSQQIDKSKLDYQEFHKLADLANAMINEHIKDRKIIIESELKYKNLVENQGEGIIIGDLKENLEFANPAASRILGLSREEIVNKNLKDFVSKEEFEKIRRQTSNRIEGVSSTYELMINRPDGQQRELMITATPLFDYQKKVVGSIGIFRDITEWNQAKRQLEKNRQLLELINKILRHDLMNQLVAIQSGVNLYSRDQKKEYLEETYKKIDSSIELIRKMKELEAIEYSKHNLKPIDTDILFKKMKLMHPSIEYQISGRCMVMANESFYSVVDNIINNAIHHGGTRKISIEIERKNRNCVIKISDFGKGIPDKIKSSIFDEGFKNGTTGKSGLGLYIVKEALNIIGGSVEVVDNEPQGATFIITIKSQ
ncbi:MAG: hypothetical protein APR54_04640 [Candidatus Cloacimonas sp. SDB]|nr:MAG: hypothetical protein APR54_04640 [Candidatus Cloacimonas sp. SDB]